MSTTVSAKPLFSLLKDRGAITAFAKKLGYKDMQRISNWRKRGIPKGQIVDVAKALGMKVENYYDLCEGKASEHQAKQRASGNIPRSDAEKLLVLIKTFLDTDADVRGDIVAAVQAVAGENGNSRQRGDNARRSKRR
jgi:hypothetical protein